LKWLKKDCEARLHLRSSAVSTPPPADAAHPPRPTTNQTSKSFLVLFFKKEQLPSSRNLV
jgi:hypothetical protein